MVNFALGFICYPLLCGGIAVIAYGFGLARKKKEMEKIRKQFDFGEFGNEN